MKTTAHALLRDRSRWLGRRRGLTVARNGDLELMKIPACADGKPIDLPATYPYPRDVSGIALGACDAVFIADTAHDRILYIDGRCGAQAWLPSAGARSLPAPGHFSAPRGLAVGPRGLWVADHGHAALQLLAFPRLESAFAHHLPCAPSAIAIDARERLLVICGDPPRLRRILPDGHVDTAFAERALPWLQAPHALAIGLGEELFVSDALADAVVVLDDEGARLATLPGPSGWMPGALAVAGARCYVADAASGRILVFEDRDLQGRIECWRGPVSALAAGGSGELLVKPGMDARYFRLTPDGARAAEGELHAGPFDAGEEEVWERAWIDAHVPSSAAVRVEVALGDSAQPPDASAWRTLPCADALLTLPPFRSARYAWLRVRLASNSPHASPAIRQIRLATAAENYLDYLPLTYRRNDTDGFLDRWLKLVRGEITRIEEAIELLPRLADPQFAPPDALGWLAQWLGLELPSTAAESEQRDLIARAIGIHARRGTSASIVQFVQLHTGIRPAIVEGFEERRVWVLGVSSRLDFDTRLPPLAPEGMIVPDTSPSTSACSPGPIGSAVVGASGPLAPYQLGLPLYAGDAFRFCVVTDAYRVRGAGVLDELHRIVQREKPAHTDYRVQIVAPELRIGLQARIGIDAIVGEEAHAGLDQTSLGVDSRLAAPDAARIGSAGLDGTLTLS